MMKIITNKALKHGLSVGFKMNKNTRVFVFVETNSASVVKK